MTRSLITRAPTDPVFLQAIGYDVELAEHQVGVHEPLCQFVHDCAIRAVAAGTEIGSFRYAADHVFTRTINLFTSVVHVDGSNDGEPVIAAIIPDGVVTEWQVGAGQDGSQAIVRVFVSAIRLNLALDSAWRLHGLFSKKPIIERKLVVRKGQPTERQVVDIRVRDIKPLDEPQITEAGQNRAEVTFRVSTRHTRQG